MKRKPRAGKTGLDVHPNAGVVVLFADDLRRRGLGDELDAVVGRWIYHEDTPDEVQHGLGVVGDIETSEVDILGRSTRVERGEQNPALEHEAFPHVADGQPGEEPFEHVELEQFLSGPASAARLILEVEVSVARRRTSHHPAHSRISNVSRSPVCVRGNDLANASNSDGWPPRRSHRLSASLARSAPSRWRIRKASMMLRSAE